MLAFLTLLVGVAIPVWGLFLLVRRGKRQLDAAIAYRHVAGELGLGVDTRGVSVQGRLGDQRLWVGEVMVGHGADRRTAIWGVLDLPRPLGLGLQVRRRGLSERVFRRGKAPGVELGDPFDRRVEIHGDSAPRVRALIGDPQVKDQLARLMDQWPDVVLTDNSVRVHLQRHETREQRLMALVEALRSLSTVLSKARHAVAVPDQLQDLASSWGPLVDGTGLTLEPWLPALNGTWGDREATVVVLRAERGYHAEIRLSLRDHKAMGLRVGRQLGPDGYWSVGQDIQLAHDAFDSSFVVKGWDPGKVRDLLNEPVRAALLELSKHGDPQVDDQLLRVQNVDVSASSIREALDRSTAVADALGW